MFLWFVLGYAFGIISGVVAISLCKSVSQVDSEEDGWPPVLYVCDQEWECEGKPCKRYGNDCSEECTHTTNINHAKNFFYEDGYYIEKNGGKC